MSITILGYPVKLEKRFSPVPGRLDESVAGRPERELAQEQ